MRQEGHARYQGRLSKVFRCKGRNFSNVSSFNKMTVIGEASRARAGKKIVSLYASRMYRDVQRISAVRRMTRRLSSRGIIGLFFRRFNSGKTPAAFLGSARSRVIYRPARRDNLHSRHPRPRFRF